MILRKVTPARWPVYRLGGGEKMFTNQRFDNWSLKQTTLEGLERLGWENATPVQRDTIPTACLLYTSPSPRDLSTSRMPSSA